MGKQSGHAAEDPRRHERCAHAGLGVVILYGLVGFKGTLSGGHEGSGSGVPGDPLSVVAPELVDEGAEHGQKQAQNQGKGQI